MAQRMEHTCIIRSLNTKNGDHGGGAQLMMHGRRDDASVRYPDLGAVLARELGQAHSQVPDYVSFYSATEGRRMAPGSGGFLGERYRADALDHEHDPGEPPPPRRDLRARPLRARRAARPPEQAVRARAVVASAGQPQRGVRARPRA